MSKHRKMKSRTKKFAAVTATTATAAAALTIGAAPSPDKEVTLRDVLLTAGPDYFQLIEDMSNSLDNIIIAQGNINEGFESFWDPISSVYPAVCCRASIRRMTTTTSRRFPEYSPRWPTLWRTARTSRPSPEFRQDRYGRPCVAPPGTQVWTPARWIRCSILSAGSTPYSAAPATFSNLSASLDQLGLLDDLVDLSEVLGLTANQSSLSTTWSWFRTRRADEHRKHLRQPRSADSVRTARQSR